MGKMKLTKSLLGLGLGALTNLALASVGNCSLVENGSNFTGTYQVQEAACAKQVFNYQTGQNDTVTEFGFVGTPEGLVVDGRLQQIATNDLSAAKPGSGGTLNAGYLSPNEFLTQEVLHFENDGVAVTNFSTDYKIGSDGVLTVVTQRTGTPGSASDNQTCHFTKIAE